jgi:hypothetical protein
MSDRSIAGTLLAVTKNLADKRPQSQPRVPYIIFPRAKEGIIVCKQFPDLVGRQDVAKGKR